MHNDFKLVLIDVHYIATSLGLHDYSAYFVSIACLPVLNPLSRTKSLKREIDIDKTSYKSSL